MSSAADGHRQWPADPASDRPARHRHRPPGRVGRRAGEHTAGLRGGLGVRRGWVEADTQPTADGVPVMLHDDDLDRTTVGQRSGASRHTVADVSGLARSSRPSPAPACPSWRRCSDDCRPDAGCCWRSRASTPAPRSRRSWPACEASGHDDRVLLQSFEVAALGTLQDLDPAVRVGLLVQDLDADPVATLPRQLGAVAYNPRPPRGARAPGRGRRPARRRYRRRRVDLRRPGRLGVPHRGRSGRASSPTLPPSCSPGRRPAATDLRVGLPAGLPSGTAIAPTRLINTGSRPRPGLPRVLGLSGACQRCADQSGSRALVTEHHAC